ncbi:MAG: hypothetical protein LCI03_18840 [Actinobacteria bacterium]|nr:hypothetical protein [Actinomycetota bacterium]
MDVARTRELSASVFGNEKWVEIQLVLDSLGGTPNAQQIAREIGINSDLVTAVLRRMESAGLIKPLPRIGHAKRGVLPWEPQQGEFWDATLQLCRLIAGE